MAIRAQDTFTDTAGTVLEDHTPSPTGTAWQVSIIKEWVIGDPIANAVVNVGNVNEIAKETTDITSANMRVVLACQTSDNKAVIGLGPMSRLPSGNVSTTANQDGFAAILEGVEDASGADVVLYRVDNNVGTEIGRWNGNIANSTFVVIRLESDGNDHEVYVDGTLRIGPITDAAYNTNQFAGLFNLSSEELVAVDNFQSQDIAAAGGLSIPVAMASYRRHHQSVF